MAPTLAATTAQVIYLTDYQDLSMSIQVSQFKGPVVATAMAPSQPVVGSPVNLAVQVTSPQVESDGVVRNPPVAGAEVDLVDDPGWTVSGSATAFTGANGEVYFQLTCGFAGDNPLSVGVGSEPPEAVQLPACNAPPPPSTTTSSTSTTLVLLPTGTTTTTVEGPPST
jgi:hypothetical protein